MWTLARPHLPYPVNSIWSTIRSYILWQHERGTLHYDIMVTLILLFVFLSPRVVNFNDKPALHNSHPTEIVVSPDGQGGLVYQIPAAAITPGGDQQVQDQLLRVIQPISGTVSIATVEKVDDGKGRVQGYKVRVKRK